MGAAVVLLFFLPWLDRGKVKSIRYRGSLYKGWLIAFVVSFLILGYLGVVPVTVWGQFSEKIPLLATADKATVVAPRAHRRVLSVLHPHAVVHGARQDQGSAGKGDRVRGSMSRPSWWGGEGMSCAAASSLGRRTRRRGDQRLGRGSGLRLEPAPAHRLDMESLQRGARNFANYCSTCHGAQYMRYNRLGGPGTDR